MTKDFYIREADFLNNNNLKYKNQGKDIVYSDLPKSGSELIKNKFAVEESLDNILVLSPYDIPFNPVGANLEHLLFRAMDEDTAHLIKLMLLRAINRFDSRIKIINKETKVIPNYNYHTYDITIAYTIEGLPYEYFYERKITNGDT